MNTVTLLLNIINEGLKFINTEHATEIQNRLKSLGDRWDEEYSKGESRDDAELALLDRELLDVGNLFLASLKSTQP